MAARLVKGDYELLAKKCSPLMKVEQKMGLVVRNSTLLWRLLVVWTGSRRKNDGWRLWRLRYCDGKRGSYDEYVSKVRAAYKERFGKDPRVIDVVISDGARQW